MLISGAATSFTRNPDVFWTWGLQICRSPKASVERVLPRMNCMEICLGPDPLSIVGSMDDSPRNLFPCVALATTADDVGHALVPCALLGLYFCTPCHSSAFHSAQLDARFVHLTSLRLVSVVLMCSSQNSIPYSLAVCGPERFQKTQSSDSSRRRPRFRRSR